MSNIGRVEYSVESIVCDSAVYSTYKGEKSLICICNSRANALLIRDILTDDRDHKVYTPYDSADASLGEVMGALDALYQPHSLHAELTPYGMCIEIHGGRITRPTDNETDTLRQISHRTGENNIHLIRKFLCFTLWEHYIV